MDSKNVCKSGVIQCGRGDIMNDIVNLIINSSTSVVIIAYFIFRDYKWNNKLVESLTKIETLLDEINNKGVKK